MFFPRTSGPPSVLHLDKKPPLLRLARRLGRLSLLIGPVMAQAQAGYMVGVAPRGPVHLPANGSQTLTAEVNRPAFNRGGSGCGGGSVVALALQPDGKLVIAGAFSQYNRDPAAPQRLLRLHPDGKRDITFNPGGSGFSGGINSGLVYDLVLQPDGKILAGGTFTAYNGVAVPTGLVRLLPDGRLDPGFNPGGSGIGGPVPTAIWSLALQPDGKIVVGGSFLSYNGNLGAPDRLLRLNADGTLDPDFNRGGEGVNRGTVFKVLVLADGKIAAGGNLRDYNSYSQTSTGFFVDGLLRLLPDGALDTGYYSSFNDPVWDLAQQPDGKLLVAGEFTRHYTATAATDVSRGLTRLLPTGARDPTFNPTGIGFDKKAESVVMQPDGRVLVGGDFTSYNGDAAASDHLLRLRADGSLDPSFNAGGSGFDAFLWSLAVQDDGRIVAGGNFSFYNGSFVSTFLTRLRPDGQRNDTDEPVPNATYRWTGGATTPTLSVVAPGSYAVTVTAGNCSLTSAPVTITGGILAAAPATPLSAGLRLYPNPARGTVRLTVPKGPGAARLEMALYNGLGQCVRTYEAGKLPGNGLEKTLDIGTLPAGLYLLRLTADGESLSKRLLVE